MAKATAPKASRLRQVRDMVKKVFKDDDPSVDLDPQAMTKSFPTIPTGSIIIDHLIGGNPNRHGVPPCPGFPKGRIINLYGHESSGKTTLALMASARVIKNGGSVVYIDFENDIVPAYAKALGVPIEDEDAFYLVQPDTLEEGLRLLYIVANAGVELVVVDSVGAGVPDIVASRDVKEQGNRGQVGAVASRWSEFLPFVKHIVSETGTTILGISQLRSKISTGPSYGGGGEDMTDDAQGGKAWRFYPTLRMRLRRVKTEKGLVYDAITHSKVERPIMSTIRCKMDKCKVSPNQGSEADFYIRFGEGIDDVRSIAEIAVAHGLVSKSGSWLSFTRKDGSEIRRQSMEQFRMALKDTKANKGAYEELAKATLAALSSLPKVSAITAEEDETADPIVDMAAVDDLLAGKEAKPSE